tara:strand:+ start:762 stop:956 length:195 start_codon:yes stop_codon:yes gene_type:complete
MEDKKLSDQNDEEIKQSYYELLNLYNDTLDILKEILEILDGRELEKLAFEGEMKKRNITADKND